MRRYLFAGLGMLAISPLVAGEVVVRAPGVGVHVETGRSQPAAAVDAAHQAEDPKAAGTAFRASEVIGCTVKNAAGETLGEVEDLVFDTSDGSIRYAAVSMGGFLGMGDKLFAVPWSSIRCTTFDEEHICLLNVAKAKLEQATGFDQDQWPNLADPKWRADNDRHFGVDVQVATPRR